MTEKQKCVKVIKPSRSRKEKKNESTDGKTINKTRMMIIKRKDENHINSW